MASLRDIFAAPNMLGIIRNIVGGVPNPFPPELFTTTRNVIGNAGTYTEIADTRTVARQVDYGGKSLDTVEVAVGDKPVILAHFFENKKFNPITLQWLMQFDNPAAQAIGIQQIGFQTEQFKLRMNNTRVAMVAQLLALGHIYFDAGGNLLPSSVGAAIDVDMGISAQEQGQLPMGTGGNIITASWATASTDIIGQVVAMKYNYLKRTGMQLKYALYSKTTPSHILGNTALAKAYAYNVPALTALQMGDIPNGTLGLTWLPAYGTFFMDQNGTLQDLWQDGKIVLLPAIDRNWWEFIQGSYPVPTTVDILTDPDAAVKSLRLEWGQFTYAKLSQDPVTVVQYAGDTCLPIIKVKKAILQAQTTF